MKRISLLGMLLALCCFSTLAQPLATRWSGQLDTGRGKMDLSFYFKTDLGGQPLCFLDLSSQNVKNLPGKVHFISTDSMSLQIPSIGLWYQARREGQTMKGYFMQRGLTLPLELKGQPMKPEPVEAPKEDCGQPLSGTWTGVLDVKVAQLHLVFHLVDHGFGQTVCTMDSPDQSVKGVPAHLLYLSADSASIVVPNAGISWQGRLEGQTLKGVFNQNGQTLPLDLKQEELQYQRPQEPVPPYPYQTEEVKFENPEAQATLAGTLTYPVDYQEGQQVPVVLMVTGSGPENRDEEIFCHRPFLVLADYLARHGIASLRYDDRKVGESTGKYQTLHTAEVADDALQGVKYLRQLKKFSKVGLLGHSEGANVVFILGAQKQIDFGVSLAGVGVLGRKALYAQARKIVETNQQTFPYDETDYMKLVEQQENPWLDYFVAYDPTPEIRKTFCPVFALNGEKDLQVLAELNLKSIGEQLPKQAKNQIKLYPELNHLFQHCKTGLPTEYSGIEETMSPEVLQDIADWINSL